MSQLKIKNGNEWVDIPAGGVGVPSGGTTGQVLTKSSSTDYATEWAEPQIPIVRTGMVEVHSWTYGKCYLQVDNKMKLAWLAYVGNDANISGRQSTNFDISQYCIPSITVETIPNGLNGGQVSIYKNTSGVTDGQVYIYQTAKYFSQFLCFPIE